MTTITIAAGMRDWSVTDWIAFFGAAAAFLTVTVGPFIAKIIADIRSLRTQNAGQQQQINDVKSDVRSVTAAAMSTPTPSVEQIAEAVKREQP